MSYYLIQFTHEGWCQGPEDMTEQRLVQARSFAHAVEILETYFSNVRYAENMTL